MSDACFGRNEHVGIIRLSGLADQEKTSCLTNELTDLCHEISCDRRTRVVVLTGTEENSFRVDSDPVYAKPGGNECGQVIPCSLVDPIANLKQPVIAAINGDAIGRGLELAAACDIRIGTEGARFGLLQIREGFIPSDGGTQRLPRLVGPARALEMILPGN